MPSKADTLLAQLSNLAVAPILGTGDGKGTGSSSGWGTPVPTQSDVSSGGPVNNCSFRRLTAAANYDGLGSANQDYITISYILPGLTIGGVALVQPSTVYTLSIYVRCSIAQKVHVNAQYLKGAGGATGGLQTTGPDVTLTPNTWTRVSDIGTTSGPDTQGVRVDVDSAAGCLAWATGNTFDFTCVMVQPGSTLTPFGDSTPGSIADKMYLQEKSAYAGPLTGPLSMNDYIVGNGHNKYAIQ